MAKRKAKTSPKFPAKRKKARKLTKGENDLRKNRRSVATSLKKKNAAAYEFYQRLPAWLKERVNLDSSTTVDQLRSQLKDLIDEVQTIAGLSSSSAESIV